MTQAESNLPPDLYHRRLLNSGQVCELLGGISRVTLWRLTRRKKDPLPCMKVSKYSMFAAEEVMWWRDKMRDQ